MQPTATATVGVTAVSDPSADVRPCATTMLSPASVLPSVLDAPATAGEENEMKVSVKIGVTPTNESGAASPPGGTHYFAAGVFGRGPEIKHVARPGFGSADPRCVKSMCPLCTAKDVASSVKSTIILPTSVRSIGSKAFLGWEDLSVVAREHVQFPTAATLAGFIEALRPFDVLGSILAHVHNNGRGSIGASAFEGCKRLVTCYIPPSVVSIEASVFDRCSSLAGIDLSSVVFLGASVFFECTSLEQVALPPTLVTIGPCAFAASGLHSVNIPASITKIDHFTFYCCASLRKVVLPGTLLWIGERAFERCTSLESIIIPASVVSIGRWAFCGCTSLTMIKLENLGVTVGTDAFAGCPGVDTVVDQVLAVLDVLRAHV